MYDDLMSMLTELHSYKSQYNTDDPIQKTFIDSLFNESINSLERLTLALQNKQCRRMSNLKFQIVNVGIDLYESGKHAQAEDFLRTNGISDLIIGRVLSGKGKRRSQ